MFEYVNSFNKEQYLNLSKDVMVIELYKDWYSDWELSLLKKVIDDSKIDLMVVICYILENNHQTYPLIHYYGKEKKEVEFRGFQSIYKFIEQNYKIKLNKE